MRDNRAIPAKAKNKAGALKLINFLLRPDVAAKVAETIGYPTPNLVAKACLPPAVAKIRHSIRLPASFSAVNGRMLLATPDFSMKPCSSR